MRILLCMCILLSVPLTTYADVGFVVNGKNLTPNNPPVLFLPGFQGSRLHAKQGDSFIKAWEPLRNERLKLLEMSDGGESLNEVRVGTIIDAIDVFEDVLFSFNRVYGIAAKDYLKNQPKIVLDAVESQLPSPLRLEDFLITADESMTWYTYPYDWRKDVFDIVEQGTKRLDGETIYLEDIVKTLYEASEGPIHIVAHSNGGLLARALLIHLEERGMEHMVESATLVGSPQSGTPKAIAALLHGHGQRKFLGLVISGKTTREISKNMPGAYALLPFETYFDGATKPVVTKRGDLPGDYENWFSGSVDSFIEFTQFITGTPKPKNDSLKIPSRLNHVLFNKALDTHRKIHSNPIPENVSLYELAGTGLPTISGIEYKKNTKRVCPVLLLTCFYEENIEYLSKITHEGDDTVVSTSGIRNSGFLIDLEKIYETDKNIGHSRLISDPRILKIIYQSINGGEIFSEYITLANKKLDGETFFAISVHSPVLIEVTNAFGKKTGIKKITGTNIWEVTEEIPGSFVDFIGEGKYIFLPSEDYSIEIQGTDTGSFDLKFSTVEETGEIKPVQSFKNIPITAKSSAKVKITNSSFENLSLDIEGDSDTDFVFSINEDQNQTLSYLREQMNTLELRKTLTAAINTYLDHLETETDADKRATYVSQLERIIKFLNSRHITQETATNWVALVQNLL